MKISNAVKRLEAESDRNEAFFTMITQHEAKLQSISSEIQKLQNISSSDAITELTDTVNELKTRSISGEPNAADPELVNKLQSQVQNLKDELIKTISEVPVLTYDEHREEKDEMHTITREDTSPEFKNLVVNDESKYANRGILDDIIEISMGNTKLSINTDDKEREICSITNEVGGLAFRKDGSDDIWMLDRNKDAEMEFHFNSMDNIPLSINPRGVKVSKMSLNGKTISGVASSINNDTINDNTIPTVGAIVKYINANLQRMNLLNKLTDGKYSVNLDGVGVSSGVNASATTDATTPASTDTPTPASTQTSTDTTTPSTTQASTDASTVPTQNLPHCNISMVKTTQGNSLLIENETNSFSLKDDEFNVVTVSASATDGLRVSDKFKLKNHIGTLCKFVNDGVDATVGRFVELTGKAIKIDDLIVPEVKLTNKLNSMVYGLIKQIPKNEYVTQNTIYKLNSESEYVSVIKSGFLEIPVNEGSFDLGTLLTAGRNGIPTFSKNNVEAVKFCLDKKLPMVKIISIIDKQLIVEVV